MNDKPAVLHLALESGRTISIPWDEVPRSIRGALLIQAQGHIGQVEASTPGAPDYVRVSSPYAEVVSVGRAR